MNEKTIKEALLKGERVTLECKRAKSEVPKSVWETYSAFANTYGGLVLLGAQENLEEKDVAKRFTITGVDDAEKIRKDFWNIVNSKEKVSVNILRDADVEVIDMDGKNIVVINVPQADFIDKSHLIGGDQRYSDRLTYDGMWENNLFNFVTMVLPKLTRELPRPFKMVEKISEKTSEKGITDRTIQSDIAKLKQMGILLRKGGRKDGYWIIKNDS